jgi:hypothetical protein
VPRAVWIEFCCVDYQTLEGYRLRHSACPQPVAQQSSITDVKFFIQWKETRREWQQDLDIVIAEDGNENFPCTPPL